MSRMSVTDRDIKQMLAVTRPTTKTTAEIQCRGSCCSTSPN